MDDRTRAMIRVLGGMKPGLGSFLYQLFTQFEIAEEEMEYAAWQFPQRKEVIKDCFLLLTPGPLLQEAAENCYRWHCRELLDRVGNEVSDNAMALITDGELLNLFYHASMRAPFNSDGMACYLSLMAKWLPEKDMWTLIDASGTKMQEGLTLAGYLKSLESWTGSTDTLLGQLRHKHDNLQRNPYGHNLRQEPHPQLPDPEPLPEGYVQQTMFHLLEEKDGRKERAAQRDPVRVVSHKS